MLPMQTKRTLVIIAAGLSSPALSSATTTRVAPWQARGMSDSTPERWRLDAGGADVALLEVPPALAARRFEVDVRLVVRCPESIDGAWHALTVELDGRRHWSRRIATSNPGQTDSLDYHCRVDVPEGSGLRIRALAQARGAQRDRLLIEAEES